MTAAAITLDRASRLIAATTGIEQIYRSSELQVLGVYAATTHPRVVTDVSFAGGAGHG